MFDRIKRVLCPPRETTPTEIVEQAPVQTAPQDRSAVAQPHVDADPEFVIPGLGEFIFGGREDFFDGGKGSPQPMSGMGRPYGDELHACDIKDCVRPSAYTVLTTARPDVDIPNTTQSRLHNQDKLPTYQEYRICDRCYRNGVLEGGYTPFVLGPQVLYNADKDKKTRTKLENAERAKELLTPTKTKAKAKTATKRGGYSGSKAKKVTVPASKGASITPKKSTKKA